MRVLITVPSLEPEFGGPPAKARRLSEELRALGHVVRVAGAGAPTNRHAVGLPIVSHYHGTPIPGRLGEVTRLARRADVVHVMGYRDPIGMVAALAARQAHVPLVMEPVGMHRRRSRNVTLKLAYDRSIGDRVLERAAAVVATSSLEAGELIEDGLDPSIVLTRPNGVDVAPLMPLPERGPFRDAHRVPSDAPLVLSLGRITRKKGLVMFVRALARLPGVWGAVVGPDDGDGTLAGLRAALDRLGLRRVVIAPRGLWGADKGVAFADADAFCLPSATENFGNAPAEAAALGLPVAVSRECGVVEFLDERATAVIDHTDVGSVVAGIERTLRPDVGEAALAGAAGLRASLSWERQAARQEEIYRLVTASPQRHRTRRVLFTVPSLRPSYGGPALHVPQFADALRARGYDVRVASSDAGQQGVDLGRRGSFHGTPIPARLTPLVGEVRRADIVHVMGFRDPAGTAAAVLAGWLGVPLVVEPMGMYRRRVRSVHIKTAFDRTFGRAVVRRARLVVATSSLERDELVLDGVPRSRIIVRPNGIDVGDPEAAPGRGPFRLEHGIPLDAPLVLFLGRITMKKGSVGLVHAVARIPGVWLAVVGPDDGDGTVRDLRDEIARLGIGNRVRVDAHGRWGADRLAAFTDADAFCLPSMTENFGNAPAEAAMLGVPVVVTDRCGVAEFLPSSAHRVVAYDDAPALRTALEWALRPQARSAAEKSADEVRARLAWPRVAAEQDALYERLGR